MRYLNSLFLIILFVFLLGCGKVDPIVITEKKYVPIVPSDELLKCEESPVLLEEPFDDIDVSEYILTLHNRHADCYNTLNEVRTFIYRELERVEQLNQQED